MAVTVMIQKEYSVSWENCSLRLIPIAMINSFKYSSFKVIALNCSMNLFRGGPHMAYHLLEEW